MATDTPAAEVAIGRAIVAVSSCLEEDFPDLVAKIGIGELMTTASILALAAYEVAEPVIRADEREACARLAEEVDARYDEWGIEDAQDYPFADLIRGRASERAEAPEETTP